jgi:hypothetical protein
MAPMMLTRRVLPLGLSLIALVSLSACTSRPVDLQKVLQVTGVSTGYFDAGIVEGGKNKIVPTISVQLKNVGSETVVSVQMIAKFNRVGETEEWGSAPYVRAIGPEGLAPGRTGSPVVMKCDRGYTGEQPRADLFHHSQFVDVRVELFGKYQAQSWVKMGEYKIARDLLTQ